MRVPEEDLPSTAVRTRLRADGSGRVTATESDVPTCPGKLLVVSNRQPYRHEYASDAPDAATDGTDAVPDQNTDDTASQLPAGRSVTVDEPTGGLTAGLDPIVQETEGTWIAWGDGDADFTVTDDRNCVEVPPDDPAYTLRRVPLSDEAVNSYYRGFSNQVLWPLCHEFPALVEAGSNDFEWYRTVNERFAEATAEHASADSVIWLQDYHFALAPQLIRDSVPQSATIAQFWHIPWPTATTFRHCPAGRQLLIGLLGNDLLGFHIDRYVDHFLDCVDRYLPGAVVNWRHRTVRYDGATTRVVATPMGVNATSHASDAVAGEDRSSLLGKLDIDPDCTIGLGVDRLDYSKGIPERLAAVERFFERNPSWKGAFTFVQKATPSRTEIETYEQYGNLVRSEVERINMRFGRDGWEPIVYTEQYLDTETLAALYRHADLMIVSPLLDGMNLVAQEFVAASVDADSCLLLSDRTGAHDRLGSHALSIDPTDTDGFATQLERALEMTPHERTRRMNTLRTRVFDGDLKSWMRTQFDWIRRIHIDERDPDRDRESDEYTSTV